MNNTPISDLELVDQLRIEMDQVKPGSIDMQRF